MTFFKRISGLTLISNQILQKGTARMAAVLFPGLITFHCSLLMSQLFLSSHNYTVFICSSSCGQTQELEPCLHTGGMFVLQGFYQEKLPQSSPFLFLFVLIERLTQCVFSVMQETLYNKNGSFPYPVFLKKLYST